VGINENTKKITESLGKREGRLVQKYRGFAGSIRCIDAHPTESHFISCGIDRFAIVHDLNRKKEVVKKVHKYPKMAIIYNSFSFLDLLQTPADLLPHFRGKFTHREG
jgi:hypothetical protein